MEGRCIEVVYEEKGGFGIGRPFLFFLELQGEVQSWRFWRQEVLVGLRIDTMGSHCMRISGISTKRTRNVLNNVLLAIRTHI